MGFPLDHFPKAPHTELICGVCTDVLSQPVEATCGHVFCSDCLSAWFQSSRGRLCPSCRAVTAQIKSARDLPLRCSASEQEGQCEWVGPVSEFFRHREECALYLLTAEAAEMRPQGRFAALREPLTDLEPSGFANWFHLLYFLLLPSMAGLHIANGNIVRMWAMMVFSLLGMLEPGTSMPMFTSAVFLMLDELHSFFGAGSLVIACLSFGWLVSVLAAIGTIRLSTQRPTPPHLVVSIGDTSFAMPLYYNIALTVIAGAVGYYKAYTDSHKYVVSCCALVVGVLLPFAVRMYRRRLPLDDLPVWRNGLDDLSLLYLCTSILSGTEFFNFCVLDYDSLLYAAVCFISTCVSVGAALLTVTEACLLGCATRWQVLGVAMPLAMLVMGYPSASNQDLVHPS